MIEVPVGYRCLGLPLCQQFLELAACLNALSLQEALQPVPQLALLIQPPLPRELPGLPAAGIFQEFLPASILIEGCQLLRQLAHGSSRAAGGRQQPGAPLPLGGSLIKREAVHPPGGHIPILLGVAAKSFTVAFDLILEGAVLAYRCNDVRMLLLVWEQQLPRSSEATLELLYPGGDRLGIGRGRQRFETAQVLRSEEHTSELQSRGHLVCRLLLAEDKTNE